jgi:hypothetical protein
LMELYGLVSIVDGQFFGDETTFKTMYSGARPDILTLNSLRTRIAPIYKRHLRRDVQEAGHVSFTRRMATTFDFESSDTETRLYEKVQSTRKTSFRQRNETTHQLNLTACYAPRR